MVPGGRTEVRPVRIASPSGPLFGVYYAANAPAAQRRAVVYVPPFAEEMNRSRRMAALQARAFASIGVATLVLDLFGTGDSGGDFRDARVPLWLGDIAAAADWLDAQGNRVDCLWGLRFGALLAATVAASQPERFRRLMLWQPVTDGKVMLTQFLRIRVAAAMAEGGPAEKTEELRAQLAAGTAVEVAGYELAPELAAAIDGLRLDRLHLARDTRVDWLEAGAEAREQILPAGARIAHAWREARAVVSVRTITGEPFWSLQETTLAPALLAATAEAMQMSIA